MLENYLSFVVPITPTVLKCFVKAIFKKHALSKLPMANHLLTVKVIFHYSYAQIINMLLFDNL